LKDLSEITEYIDVTNEEKATEKVWKVCKRHGKQVEKALRRMRNIFDKPFYLIPNNSLLGLVARREHLKEPVLLLVQSICEHLNKALPMAFHRNLPKNENDLNDKVSALIQSDRVEFEREHPSIRFACTNVIPDHSTQDYELLIESKYLRGSTSPTKVRDGIAADLIEYPQQAHILFVVYGPEHQIYDDDKYRREFENQRRCTILIVR